LQLLEIPEKTTNMNLKLPEYIHSFIQEVNPEIHVTITMILFL